MLMAAGLAVPKRIWVHGFVLVGGTRVSKSAGGNLDLREAIGRYGADAFRYFLLREVPFDGDGNFSWERFEERYNADLANAFGQSGEPHDLDGRALLRWSCSQGERERDRRRRTQADLETYHASFGPKGFLLHDALKAVWQTVSRANEYVDRQAPWKLAKDPASRAALESTLASLMRQLARQAVYSVAVHARGNRRSCGSRSALLARPRRRGSAGWSGSIRPGGGSKRGLRSFRRPRQSALRNQLHNVTHVAAAESVLSLVALKEPHSASCEAGIDFSVSISP